MIKAIIFDLGNVVVKIDKAGQFKKFAASSNKPIPYIKKYFENSSARKAFERGEIDPRHFYEGVSKDLNLKISFDNFKNAWCDIFSLNEDVERLIRKLKGNFKLVLLSNTDALHFGHIESKYKIVNAFDEQVLSYKVGCRKPNPMIFLNALKKANALPFNCLYIDDIPEFVYIARLMGMKALQYTNFEKLVCDLDKAKILSAK